MGKHGDKPTFTYSAYYCKMKGKRKGGRKEEGRKGIEEGRNEKGIILVYI
jgi:hypothetical protein